MLICFKFSFVYIWPCSFTNHFFSSLARLWTFDSAFHSGTNFVIFADSMLIFQPFSIVTLISAIAIAPVVKIGSYFMQPTGSAIRSEETSTLQPTKDNKHLLYMEDNKLGVFERKTKSVLEFTDEEEDTDSGDDIFKLLTFNTWGLKYVSKYRKERLTAIADKLAKVDSETDDYDVVALQEIWTSEDWEYFEKVCAEKYPYRRWFSAGIITGPGLAILSKYPIKKTFLYRFPINGRPSAFFRGDWYVGKSVSVTILCLKDGSTIAVLNSHMHAPYSKFGDAAYETHRACQAWEIANIVEELRDAGHAVILVGDLNSRPGSLQYKILEKEAGLKDSWELLHGKTDLELVKNMEPWEQVIRAATTCDSVLNTWRADRRPDEACRLDYALVDRSMLTPLGASVEFTVKIPNVGSYSDHFAYSATFKLRADDGDVETAATEVTDDELLKIYQDLKLLINDYISTTLQWQRSWRLWHFFISVIVAVAFLPVITVVSYRAPWSSILFYFFGCVIFATGVVNGLISFLFGRYELRNLREVVFEVDDRINYLNNKLF